MKKLKMSLWMTSLSLLVRLAVPVEAGNWQDEMNPNAATAQSPAWEFSLMGGGAVPVGDDSEGLGGKYLTSGLIQGSIIRNLNPMVGIGMEIGHSFGHSYDLHLDPYTQYYFNPELDVQISQFTPVLQIGRWFGYVKPYLAFGGGLYHIKGTVSVTDPYYGYRYSYTSSTDAAGINAGAGLMARLGQNLSIGPDIRYHKILGNSFPFQYVTTTLRMAFLF